MTATHRDAIRRDKLTSQNRFVMRLCEIQVSQRKSLTARALELACNCEDSRKAQIEIHESSHKTFDEIICLVSLVSRVALMESRSCMHRSC